MVWVLDCISRLSLWQDSKSTLLAPAGSPLWSYWGCSKDIDGEKHCAEDIETISSPLYLVTLSRQVLM